MVGLKVSSDFTIEDIHKVREYNYEVTKDMTVNERRNYYKVMAEKAVEKIDKFKKEF